MSTNKAKSVASAKAEKKNTHSPKTNSHESYREKALSRVLLVSTKNTSDDEDNDSHDPMVTTTTTNNYKLDRCSNVLFECYRFPLKGGVTQEEFPALVALGDAFESFVTKCTGAMSATISEMQLLGIFDIALNTLSRQHTRDVTCSDSIRARLAKSVAMLAPNRETITNTRFERHLNYFR